MNKKLERSRTYIWDRCSLKQELSIQFATGASGHQRLSVTIIVACGEPLRVKREGKPEQQIRGAVIGPNVNRSNIVAEGENILILDAFITTPVYQDLFSYLGSKNFINLAKSDLESIYDDCVSSFDKEMSISEAKQLFHSIIYSVCEPLTEPPDLDSRIRQVIEIIESNEIDPITVGALAKEVALSESRLRSLFKSSMHCTLPQFIRSVNFWKCIPLLASGKNLTEAAHASGFYDLPHLSRTAAGLWGFSMDNLRKNQDVFVED